MNFDKYKAEKLDGGFASRLAGKVSAADGEYLSELAALPERKQSAGAWRTILSVAAIFAVLVAAGAWILIGLGLRNGGKIVPAGESVNTYAVRVDRGRIVEEDRAAMQGFFNDYVAEKACNLELSFLFPDEQHPMRYALTADEYGRVHNSVTTPPTGDHAYTDKDFYHLKFVLGGGDEQGMYLYFTEHARLCESLGGNDPDDVRERGYALLGEDDPTGFLYPFSEQIALDLGFIENSAENGTRVFDYAKAETVVVENGLVVSGEKSLQDFMQSYGRQQYAYVEVQQDGQTYKRLYVDTDRYAKRERSSVKDGAVLIGTLRIDTYYPQSDIPPTQSAADGGATVEKYVVLDNLTSDGGKANYDEFCIIKRAEAQRLKLYCKLYAAGVDLPDAKKTAPDFMTFSVYRSQYDSKPELIQLEKALINADFVKKGEVQDFNSIKPRFTLTACADDGYLFFNLIENGKERWIVQGMNEGMYYAEIPDDLADAVRTLAGFDGGYAPYEYADVQTDTEPEPQENVNVPEIASEYKLDFMPEFTEDNYDVGYYYYYCLYAYALDGFPENVRGKRFNEVLKMLSCPVTVPDDYYVPIIIEGVPMRYCDRTAVSYKGGVVTAKYNVYDYGYEYTEEQVKAACERGDAEQTIGCDERFTVRYETDGRMKPTRFLSCEHEYKNESGEWERPDGAGEYFRSGERARAALESWLEQNPDVKAYKTGKASGEMKDGFGKFGVWTELIPADGKKDWFLQNGFKESPDSEWLTCRSGFAFIENEDGSYTYVPGAQDANSAAEALSKLSENELKDAALRAFDKSMKERGKKTPYKEYKVNSVDIRPTSGAARDDGEYTISVSYDVKPKTGIFAIFGSGDSWLAGNGAEGEDGWIVGKSEIIYADLRDGEFNFNSVGTGP